jgi:hypothetical protein
VYSVIGTGTETVSVTVAGHFIVTGAVAFAGTETSAESVTAF